MFQKVLAFASCLVMASALRVQKCGGAHAPNFLSQKDGGLEHLEGAETKFGQVEKDLEKDLATVGLMLA